MENLGAAVELDLSPATRLLRIIKGALVLGLTFLMVWTFQSQNELAGWFLFLLLAIGASLELRRHSLRVDPEGIRIVLKYFGGGLHCRWQEISNVEVECRGRDKDDPDFCHHITLFTNEGKKIRANDHRAHNFLEFVTALQSYLVTEDQKRKLDVVIKRYAGVKHNGAD